MLIMITKTDRPGWTERICYGAGTVGVRIVPSVITGFMLIYLTNVALLDVAACSAIIGVSKLFDGISDLVIGNIIDNTVSKLGKARTWLLRMCLPLFAASVLLFRVPPQFPQILKYVYVFLMYNVVNTVIITFLMISQFSLVSLISDDRKEQTLLGSIQSMTRAIGVVVGSVVFVRLLGSFTDEPGNQNTQTAYARSMIVVCAVAAALILIGVAGTAERVQRKPVHAVKLSLNELFSSLGTIIKNRYWIVLLTCNLLTTIIFYFMATGATYYSLYILNDMSYMSLILLTNIVPNALITMLMPVLINRYGKRKLFIAAILISVAGLTGIGMVSPMIKPLLAFNVLYGVGGGLVKGVSFTLIADLVTYTEVKTGQFRPGTGNAGVSASEKLGNGLSNMIFGLALSAAGFNAALDVQPAAVSTAISALFIWVPILMFITVLVIFTLFFDLERRMDE